MSPKGRDAGPVFPAKHTEPQAVTAEFDLDSLVCFIDVPGAKFFEEMGQLQWGGGVPESARNWVHEVTHLHQSMATPFGAYLSRLRALQSAVVHDLLVRLPNEFGIRARLPLLPYVATVGAKIQEALRPTVDLWYGAEMLRTQHLGGIEGAAAAGFQLRRFSPIDAFHVVQSALAAVAGNTGALLRAGGAAGSGGIRVDPAAVGKGVRHDPASWRRSFRSTAVSKVFSGHEDLPMLLESAAYAAELAVISADSAETELRAARRGDFADVPYAQPLVRTYGALRHADVPAAIRTHLAVCDLALFPPILPEHHGVRVGGFRSDELFPVDRLARIWAVLGTVGPLHNYCDYAAFTNEICSVLDWPSPAVLTDPLLRPAGPMSQRDGLYEAAMRCRTRVPWTFVDPAIALSITPPPDAERARIRFPVIQFADRVAYGDASYAAPLILENLWHLWHRQLAIGRPERLTVPWRCEPPEVADWAGTLQCMMAASLGQDAPAPALVAPAA